MPVLGQHRSIDGDGLERDRHARYALRGVLRLELRHRPTTLDEILYALRVGQLGLELFVRGVPAGVFAGIVAVARRREFPRRIVVLGLVLLVLLVLRLLSLLLELLDGLFVFED